MALLSTLKPEFKLLSQPAVAVAPKLLGWELVSQSSQGLAAGRIVEVEAYMGQIDAASHAYRGQTRRNAVMFGPAGLAYIYFTYGMHYCFNVVTGPIGEASAVLIRALEPTTGRVLMQQRRRTVSDLQLTNGPAKLVQAFGITKELYGHDLSRPPLFLRPAKTTEPILSGRRIGIRQATEQPWRFYLKGNPYVSRSHITTEI